MITVSICDKRHNLEFDVMLQPEQKIEDALRIIQEKGLLMIRDIEYVRLGNANSLKNKKLTFQQAEIYTGEKIIIE